MSEKQSRRPRPAAARGGVHRRSSASSLLQTPDSSLLRGSGEDYFSLPYLLLFGTWLVFAAIFLLFTPFTHQLDEIKNAILMIFPPLLLVGAAFVIDPTRFTWRTHAGLMLLGLYTFQWFFAWLLNPYKLVGERVIWFQVGVSTFTVLYAVLMNSEAKLRRTMTFLVGLTLVSCLIGLFFYSGQNFIDDIYKSMRSSSFWTKTQDRAAWMTLVYTLKSSKEMYSTILNSDFFAAYLVMMLPFCVALMFVELELWRKVLGLMAFLLAVVCLFQTNSNDSFMSVVLLTGPTFVVLTALFHAGIRLSTRFIVTFAIGFSIIVITVLILMIPQLGMTWDFKQAALDGRRILWGGGWYAWLYAGDAAREGLNFKTIIFGTGPGGYRHFFPIQRRPEFFDNQINNVTTFGHNHYLDVLLETGLVGIALFLLFHGVIIINAVRQIIYTKNAYIRFYQIAVVSSLTGIALQNFFSPNNRWAVAGMVYWSLFGLSMGIWHIENPGRESQGSVWESRSLRPKIAFGAFWALVGLFLIQSPRQGISHFRSAIQNAKGLQYMDYADTVQPGQRVRFLQEAQTFFEQSIVDNPTFATAYYKLGHVYNQLSSYTSNDPKVSRDYRDKAIKIYEDLENVSPNYSEIHQNLGIMYRLAADSKYLQALEEKGDQGGIDKANEIKLRELEKAYVQIKEGARESLKPGVQFLAGTIGRTLAEQYQLMRMPEKAQSTLIDIKQFYRNIITYQPRLPEYVEERRKHYGTAMNELVKLGVETNKPNESQELLQRLVAENPDKREYMDRLLAHMDKYNKPEEKAKVLEDAVRLNPFDPVLRRSLAEVYKSANNMQGAVREWQRIESLDAKNKEALGNLYKYFRDQKRDAEAGQYADKLKAIGVDPTTVVPVPKPAGVPSASGPAPEADKFPSAITNVTTSADGASRVTTVAMPVATFPVPRSAVVPPAPPATTGSSAKSPTPPPAPATSPTPIPATPAPVMTPALATPAPAASPAVPATPKPPTPAPTAAPTASPSPSPAAAATTAVAVSTTATTVAR